GGAAAEGHAGGKSVLATPVTVLQGARREIRGVELTVSAQSAPAMIRSEMSRCGVEAGAVSVSMLPHREIPGALAAQTAGLHFLAAGGLYVGFPTKIGEYWAVGLPVVTPPGVGEIDAIVAAERVGVLVPEATEAAYRAAARERLALLQDPELRLRCRRAAAQPYSLDRGVETQRPLCEGLLRRAA